MTASNRYLTPLDPAIAAQVATLDEAERETYEERAAIRQHLGNFDRKTAEAMAWHDVLDLRQRRSGGDHPPADPSKPTP